ncbi:MAG: hypothetical protein JWM59_3600 [Verrucomicrobiales bacterium]|nr:hypothetical protein [Verrucomicrobiales bacterium]
MIGSIERARRYLARMEPAISGSGGRTAAFKAAVALARGFSLEEKEALPLLMDWNRTCLPPWTEKELRSFLRDGSRSKKPPGYLLSKRHPAMDEAGEKRWKRQQWPTMRHLHAPEMERIARLRRITPESVLFIHGCDFLWHCRHHNGEECFVIRSGPQGSFAQRRRLDGEPCTRADGTRVKSLNLPGAEGSFLQPGGLEDPGAPILLTEGAISILEAAEAIRRAGGQEDGACRPVAITAAVSAYSRFTAEALLRLQGRRVRIYSDADKAGQDAAANWTATLRTAGCTVDNILPPQGCKDLGDALRQIPAGHTYWHRLFTF